MIQRLLFKAVCICTRISSTVYQFAFIIVGSLTYEHIQTLTYSEKIKKKCTSCIMRAIIMHVGYIYSHKKFPIQYKVYYAFLENRHHKILELGQIN